MSEAPRYPKRLIEVDLPIREISAHARREKSIRHGHISTLHIWWARRPLAACRAVICAALWPDPADELCPQSFRDAVAKILVEFAETARNDKEVMALVQPHWSRWQRLGRGSWQPDNPGSWWDMRYALLDFIADFANWDASRVPGFLITARDLTNRAHTALGGSSARPVVLDSFAGGGAIPFEALRIGADTVASDLNPVAVLLNRVVLDLIPAYGSQLAAAVREWGSWIEQEAAKQLRPFYPPAADGRVPIAYIWARTVQCEGPGCGVIFPLLKSSLLVSRPQRTVEVELTSQGSGKQVAVAVVENEKQRGAPTVRSGAAICPACGFTTDRDRVRKQLIRKKGGADDAQLICIVFSKKNGQGREYDLPRQADIAAIEEANAFLRELEGSHVFELPVVPEERIPHDRDWKNTPIRVHLYGIETWGGLSTRRQNLALAVLSDLVRSAPITGDTGFVNAVRTCLALAIDRQANALTSLSRWNAVGEKLEGVYARQALPMVWDFAEINPFSTLTGSWHGAIKWIGRVCESGFSDASRGNATVLQADAAQHPLPNESVSALVTDPPYYDAVPYANLSDFFYVRLKRSLGHLDPDLLSGELVPKDRECVVDEAKSKDTHFFQATMTRAMAEGRRVLEPEGIAVVVFANKATAAWESQIQAILAGGFVVTGSWPIDTERGGRLRSLNSAALGSSVHIVCRPRENPDGSLPTDAIGDWRSVLRELPERIHEWLPRLAQEGIVGADAIFACIGPALEIFSRYSRVEKASGEKVDLREYLEHVWAAVAREALTMIFEDADATGFEEDARITAMWLWTLSTGGNGDRTAATVDEAGDESAKIMPSRGHILEFDAARKIAQGLGANLEHLPHVVEVKGNVARLLPVSERARHLLGKGVGAAAAAGKRGRAKAPQMSLFAELEAAEHEAGWGDAGVPATGKTMLDRVHQAMILFAAGRGEALKRFAVDEGAGQDPRFWKLAQALSALYPRGSDEKRWVDGVLARKKGFGFV